MAARRKLWVAVIAPVAVLMVAVILVVAGACIAIVSIVQGIIDSVKSFISHMGEVFDAIAHAWKGE